MSVYGNMIAESNNESSDNICNEMNMIYLEINNYFTFMDEFVSESIDFKKIKKRMKEKFNKLLEKIRKLIESISYKWNNWLKNKNALDLRKDKTNKKVYINLDRYIYDYERVYKRYENYIPKILSCIEDFENNSMWLIEYTVTSNEYIDEMDNIFANLLDKSDLENIMNKGIKYTQGKRIVVDSKFIDDFCKKNEKIAKCVENKCLKKLEKEAYKLRDTIIRITGNIDIDDDIKTYTIVNRYGQKMCTYLFNLIEACKDININSLSESIYLYRQYYNIIDLQTSKYNPSDVSSGYYKDNDGNIANIFFK